jgi:hypothetical protein
MVLVVRKFYSTFDLHVDLFMLVGRRDKVDYNILKAHSTLKPNRVKLGQIPGKIINFFLGKKIIN